MANRRNRPTLYEVVNRTRREPFQRKPAQSPESGAANVAEPATVPAPAPARQSTVSHTPTSAVTAAFEADARGGSDYQPIVRFSDGDLTVRVTPPAMIVGAIAMLSLFGLGYWLGQKSPRAGAVDNRDDLAAVVTTPTRSQPETPAMTSAPPPVATPPPRPAPQAVPQRADDSEVVTEPSVHTNPSRVATPSAAPVTPAAPSDANADPSSFKPEPGSYYVIIQHFPLKQRKAAAEAQKFLLENGLPTVLLGKSDLQIWATQPCASQAAAEALKDRVKALGKQYSEKGGYDFLKCYMKSIAKER